MDDPIPAGFITLPEALQRIATYVSDAHLESAKLDFQDRVRSVAAIRQDELQTASTNNEPQRQESSDFRSPSEQALRQRNKQHFAVGKLRIALQAGAISAMVSSSLRPNRCVRSPGTRPHSPGQAGHYRRLGPCRGFGPGSAFRSRRRKAIAEGLDQRAHEKAETRRLAGPSAFASRTRG